MRENSAAESDCNDTVVTVAGLKGCSPHAIVGMNASHMSRTHSAIWIHVLWSTRSEKPTLSADIQPVLLDHIRMAARNTDIHIEAVNAAVDHVHAVLRIVPRMSLADVVDRLKGESAHWMNTLELTPTHFAWEPSYIGCSVSPADVPDLCRYVHAQDDIHLHRSYAEEARALLSRDPSTLWRTQH